MKKLTNAVITLLVVAAIMAIGHELNYDSDFIAGWAGCLIFQYLNHRSA